MKILIFGAGGVGSVVGGFLARMGNEVTLLGRAWHLDVIRKNGLVITGIWGDYKIKAFELCTDIEELKSAKAQFDLVILTVKSFDTEKAIEELAPFLQVGDSTPTVLSLQNGLGNIETILKQIKPEQFLVGRVIFGVETQPGIAKVTVCADDVVIGPSTPFSSQRGLTAESAAHLLNLAKIPTRAVKDILPFIWSKVIYNCALNAICTLQEIPYGKILHNDRTKDQMKEVVRECYAVAEKKGVPLTPKKADEYIELLISSLIPKTASHFPSMLQDLRNKKRTDIDALNGAISQLGREFGIRTPVNDLHTESILKVAKN